MPPGRGSVEGVGGVVGVGGVGSVGGVVEEEVEGEGEGVRVITASGRMFEEGS